jgi:hypothetical protein
MKLHGLNLEVVNIYRKGIFELDTMVFCCDNCGRAIVNSAEVKDLQTGNKYTIGLDCKKTLIDKKHIDRIAANNPDFTAKYKIKDYKREQNDLQKVAMYLDNPNKYECVVYNYGSGQDFTVYDNTKTDAFGNAGATVFSESIPYLFRIGLRDLLTAAVSKGIIKQSK